MSSVNKIILIGNLARKPELREVSGGQLATFSLATSRSWNDKAGQKQEVTTWHRVTVWGNQAVSCANFLDKGSQAYVEGSCETREYTDKDGQQQKITEVRAQAVRFLGGRQGSDQSQPQRSPQQQRQPTTQGQFDGYTGPVHQHPNLSDDVPF